MKPFNPWRHYRQLPNGLYQTRYTCPCLMEISRWLYRLAGRDAKWHFDNDGQASLVIGHSCAACLFPVWAIREHQAEERGRAAGPRWIPVGERLPEEGRRMLCVVMIDRVKFPTVWGWMGNGWAINCTDPMLRTCKDITHWCHLPAAPETQEGKK